MSEKRRSVRVSTKTSIEDEIAHLRGLDLKGLRSRWQSVFQKPPPDHLPRHLLFAIIAYRIQADRLGDLKAILLFSMVVADEPNYRSIFRGFLNLISH
jgi:hypothetical protein